MRAGIAFGSNLGDRLTSLKTARAQIVSLPGVEELVLASSIYETAPVDCAPGTPPFLNAVMEIGYSGAGQDLLGELRHLESVAGRPNDHERNASRTLDLDLLYFGGLAFAQPGLQLPHPRLHERRFVLEPLAEIRPALILPNQSITVAELLRRLPETTPLRRFAAQW